MIARCCPYMEVLGMSKCPLILNRGLGSVLRRSKLLRELDVSGCLWVTDAVLLEIGQLCRCLMYLSIEGCKKVTDSGVTALANSSTALKHINLRNTKRISNAGMEQFLSKMPDIEGLEIGLVRKSRMTAAILNHVATHCRNLTFLDYREWFPTPVEDVLCQIAEQCQGLRYLGHKEAVVRTLLNRATNLPSNESLRSAETKRVAKDLSANGYPDRLLQKCLTVSSRPERTQERPANFASIPYVRGASDRVGRVLRKFNIRTAFKPCQTLSQIFKKPKDRPQDHQRRGIVYKVRCNDCAFTYIGESKRSWSSRGAERDPGRACNGESAIKQHAESTEHDIHPRNATILERGISSYTKRLFLESWHSTVDSNPFRALTLHC
ncbi:hypothetical protein ACROYT_G025972 [Oculina patagonica]